MEKPKEEKPPVVEAPKVPPMPPVPEGHAVIGHIYAKKGPEGQSIFSCAMLPPPFDSILILAGQIQLIARMMRDGQMSQKGESAPNLVIAKTLAGIGLPPPPKGKGL